MRQGERLERVRAVFGDGPPCEARWCALVTALMCEARPPEPVEVAYVRDHIARAPQAWRAAMTWTPGPWRGAWARGAREGGWGGLVDALGLAYQTVVGLPPRRFKMGSPPDEHDRIAPMEARHTVRLTRGVAVDTLPVTVQAWAALMDTHGQMGRGTLRPKVRMTWWDALRFCNARSRADGLPLAYPELDAILREREGAPDTPLDDAALWPDPSAPGWRLLTEAEWEYACRAGDPEARYGALHEVAWSWSNSQRKLQPVGQLAANAWGLHDMLGNAQEWVWDRCAPFDSLPRVDPIAPAMGSPSRAAAFRAMRAYRVVRGGAYHDAPRACRAAWRGSLLPESMRVYVGARIGRTLPYWRAPGEDALA